jgi:hypothetical protein
MGYVMGYGAKHAVAGMRLKLGAGQHPHSLIRLQMHGAGY